MYSLTNLPDGSRSGGTPGCLALPTLRRCTDFSIIPALDLKKKKKKSLLFFFVSLSFWSAASNVGSHRRQIPDLLDQSIQISSQCFVITADNRFILLCGFWDKSFRVYSTDSGMIATLTFQCVIKYSLKLLSWNFSKHLFLKNAPQCVSFPSVH